MRGLILGAIAGAAGTMALDYAGYLDMALRGRAPSDMPAEVIRRLALKAGLLSFGSAGDGIDDATKNRRSALGALSGYKVGILLGALYGAVSYPSDKKRSIALRALVLGALAMAATDVPSGALGATNLAEWGVSGWVSDIIPHAAYGLVTAAVFETIA